MLTWRCSYGVCAIIFSIELRWYERIQVFEEVRNMAFTDYKSIEQVLQKEPVKILNDPFLPEQLTIDLPDWFLQDITFALSIKVLKKMKCFMKNFSLSRF